MENKYSTRLHLILSRIYRMRAVSYLQISRYILSGLSENYIDKIIKMAVSDGYLNKNGRLKTEAYYFITKKGISYLKKYGIIELGSYSGEFVSTPADYLTAGEVSFKPVYKNHQLALNEFVFMFEEVFGESFFSYCDEKNASMLVKNIRPDGVLLFNDTLYFLEMDMNTERAARLQKKWRSYRYFVSSTEYTQFNYNIKVLFILDGVSTTSERKYALWNMIIANMGDLISEKFNVYVDTNKNLIDLIINDVTNHKTLAAREAFGQSMVIDPRTNFENSIWLKSRTDLGLVGGQFLSEIFNGISTICHIINFPKFRALYKTQRGADIGYIIILDQEQDVKRIGEVVAPFRMIPDGLFFTTQERLEKYPLNQALFAVDETGSTYHYDNTWSRRVIEQEKTG